MVAGEPATATVTIHDAGGVPPQPTDGLSATPGAGQITVHWDGVEAEPAVSGYALEYQSKPVGGSPALAVWSSWQNLATPNAEATSYLHSNLGYLQPNLDLRSMRYRYQVRATNDRGDSDWSVSFPTAGVVPLLGLATGVRIGSVGNGLSVLLDCPLDDPQCDSSPGGSFPSFIVERKSGTGIGWQVVYTSLSTGAPARGARGPAGASGGSLAPSYTVSVADLDSTVAYQFRVRLVNADGQAGAASEAVAVVPLEVQGADGQATLSWTHPGYPLITQWQYRTRAGTALWEEWENISSGGGATTRETVPNLTNGVDYQFQVRALNVIGTEAITASFIVAATPAGAAGPAGEPDGRGRGWTGGADLGDAGGQRLGADGV